MKIIIFLMCIPLIANAATGLSGVSIIYAAIGGVISSVVFVALLINLDGAMSCYRKKKYFKDNEVDENELIRIKKEFRERVIVSVVLSCLSVPLFSFTYSMANY